MNAHADLPTVAGLRDRPGDAVVERRDWRRALGALRRLLADNEDTTQVFEIMRALNRGSTRAGYLRLIAGPTGARLAYEHVELEARLMDDAWLDGFADGTVGAAYRAFVRGERLSALGLAQVSKAGLGADQHDQPDPVAWYGRRVRDIHDLWHILTGYGRDPLGEASLVAFSYSQTRGLGWLAIALGALAKGGLGHGVRGVRGAVIEGFRNGRKAAWLPGLDYEKLMGLPLDVARAELGIRPPARYRAVVARTPMLQPSPESRMAP
jgi:ubiquinone biosynthesis protein COQ4